jgi:hypothetical protein
MRVISVRQPWAGLIFHGKDVENRTWATGYRGPLLIHAAKKEDWEGFHFFARKEGQELMGRSDVPPECFLIGGIIGMVELAGCFHHSRVRSGRSAWHASGQYGFYLARPQLFTSMIRCRGHLGIYDPPADVLAQAERLLNAIHA